MVYMCACHSGLMILEKWEYFFHFMLRHFLRFSSFGEATSINIAILALTEMIVQSGLSGDMITSCGRTNLEPLATISGRSSWNLQSLAKVRRPKRGGRGRFLYPEPALRNYISFMGLTFLAFLNVEQ